MHFAHFAEWAGVAPAAADRAWRPIEPELVEVSFAESPVGL
ncbi:MAG: hypothetical protein ACYC3V_15675 [Chloroflexota bacterium]